MKNAEYWRERFKILEEAANNKANQSIEELMKVFREAERAVISDIESWYARFAKNNQISVADARKMLTTGQLDEFRWTVDRYIEIGQQGNLSAEWMKRLENASARFHVSRLEAIQLQIQQQMELLYGNQLDSIDDLLSTIISNGYTQGMYEVQKGVGFGWNFTALDQKKIDMLLSKPWTSDGRTFRTRCWMHKADLLSGIQSDMLQGMLRGEGLLKTSTRIAKRFNVSRNKAANLVHTESTYFNGVANQQLYKELDVDSVEIIETLDNSTCEICGPLDGKIVPMSAYQPGVTVPPFHPRCRGTTAPAIDPDIIGERIARDEDGNTYYVPSNMTYEEWYRKYVEDVPEAAAAEKKYKNRFSDKKQYKQYIERLGKKNVAKSFDSFQNIKYTDGKEWRKLQRAYKDKPLRDRLQSNEQPKTIEVGKQGKHIKGHNNYIDGRSYLTISTGDAQKLVDRYAGTGELRRDSSGRWVHKEFITVEKPIGVWVDPNTKKQIPTTRFAIHYSKKGVHIVPTREEE